MMLRLLSAEGYRLRKSKSFYICAAVMVSFVFVVYFMLLQADRIQRGEAENGTAGVVVSKEDGQMLGEAGSIWDEIGIFDVMRQEFSGGLAACVMAVYVRVIVIGAYSCGMVKNIVGKGSPRPVIYLARLFMAIASSVAVTLIGIIAVLAGGVLFIGKSAFEGNFWQYLFVYCGLQILMAAALVAVYVLTSEITRSMAAGISVGIGVAVLPEPILTSADLICEKYGFTPSQFWLVSRSGSCPVSDFTTEYIIETVIVAAVWFLVAAGLGIWHFCRTDIK